MDEKNLPRRKKTRLKGYDYSSNGRYFITVCTKDKKHILAHYKKRKCRRCKRERKTAKSTNQTF